MTGGDDIAPGMHLSPADARLTALLVTIVLTLIIATAIAILAWWFL